MEKNNKKMLGVLGVLIVFLGILFVYSSKNNPYTESPNTSCDYSKEKVVEMQGQVNFHNDCKVYDTGNNKEYVSGSYQGKSYNCIVMYYDNGKYSDTKCSLF